MTTQNDIENDPQFIKVLDKGFVGIVDFLGSDSAIVQAARVSYGAGTKSVREDKGLIRYLMRMRHTSPFEMCTVKFLIKAPIFVIRQLSRHRTASENEYSARYSVVPDEFYIPDIDHIKQQSATNNQGSGSNIVRSDSLIIQRFIEETSDSSYSLYESFLGSNNNVTNFQLGLSHSFKGIARETARMVLPVNVYTELYFQQNLHNLFHLLKLRMDPHAQLEIRELANAMYALVYPLYPLAAAAFEDYSLNALTVSRMERDLMKTLTNSENLSDGGIISTTPKLYLKELIKKAGSEKEFALSVGMNEREFNDFIINWNFT